jgi:hypothetical protein
VLQRGKKRKAAWKDEADSEVRVKDVAKTFRSGCFPGSALTLHMRIRIDFTHADPDPVLIPVMNADPDPGSTLKTYIFKKTN